jgi:hypothetical protein
MGNFKVGELYDESFRKLQPKDRHDNLASVCYEEAQKNYTKNLTEEEVLDRKEEYAEMGLVISEMEDEKKNYLEAFKERMKPKKEKAQELLSSIKFKSEQRFGNVYSVDDQEEGMMYFFDDSGYCVDARPLTRDERQTRIKQLNN